jgi:DNA-binding transcriptional LysR family regulator
VLAGAGVAAMPTYFAHHEPDLVMVNTGEYACLRFWLVFDRENGERARVREVIQWIKGLFEARRNPWFREELIEPAAFQAMLAR